MNAPNINIKDVLKKLSFLKNNMALLVPIVIVIVALLLFIPTSLFGGKLRTKVEDQSVATGKQVDRLMRDGSSTAEAASLEARIHAEGRDANEIDTLVAQMVMRELLSYDIFPDTNETSLVLYERFGQRYRDGIEAMLESLRAGVCPTDDELETALKQAPRRMPQRGLYGGEAYGADAMYGGGAYGGGGYGGGMYGTSGRRRSLRLMGPTQRKIANQICLDKANVAGVYASPADIAGYAYWSEWKFEDKDKAYKDCWYWQLGYWIIEDVVTTVHEMNASAQSVLDAPVKRLVSVSFKMQRSRGRRRGGVRRGARGATSRSTDSENPVYATNIRDAMTVPCTGRFTNENMDVVQFNVRLVVNVTQVVPFMEELCSEKPHKFRGFSGDQPEQDFVHNQISVLESSVGPLDKESPVHELYRYGDLPVVELDLLCEYVFDKTPEFEAIKPQQIKDELAGEEEDK